MNELNELTALAHRFKDNPLLSVRLQHAAYHLQKQSPLAKHAVSFVLQGVDSVQPKKLCSHIVSKAQQFKKLLNNAKEEAVHTASLKLQHGSTVVANQSALVDAFLASGKKIQIHSAAHSRAKNATIHDDHMIHAAIKSADFVLLGNAAITPEGIIASAGAGLLAELAHAQGIPTYVAAIGLDFSKVTVPKKDHELLHPNQITGIISELGVYSHALFVKAAEQTYPFISSLA